MPLDPQQKGAIAQQQVELKAKMIELCKDYPDLFYIGVHTSDEMVFSGTTGRSEVIAQWLVNVMIDNPAFHEFFRGCVTSADEYRAANS